MALQFAEVVAQLVEAVLAFGDSECGEDGLVDLLCVPATHLSTTMQEDFQEANNARVMQPDSGLTDRADRDGQGEPLQLSAGAQCRN